MKLDYPFYAVVTISALLSACTAPSVTFKGGGGEKVTLSNDGKNITIKGSDGKSTVSEIMTNNYPPNFPVAQYPGSTITNNMTMTNDGKSQTFVMLSTTDKAPQILKYYKDQLSSSGWKIDNSSESSAMGSDTNMSMGALSASKGSSHLDMSAIGGEKDTAISLGLK